MTDKTEDDEFDTLLELGCVTSQDLADDEHEVLTEDIHFFKEPKTKEILSPYSSSFITILALDYDNQQRQR